MADKIIKECPVCHSTDFQQCLGNTASFLDEEIGVFGVGSFCTNCGVRFAFNTDHLESDIVTERAFLTERREKLRMFLNKG